jgi:SagB-type dehydrogenase family enzyme
VRLRIVLIAFVVLSGCAGTEDATPEAPGGTVLRLDLPPPDTTGGLGLADALTGRRSVRDFTDQPLELAEVSQLLWATQGITSEDGKRTAPSAGATYPLELYLVTDSGLYHYQPDQHSLRQLAEGDLRGELARAALDQEPVAAAAATFAVAAVYARTGERYGDRAERYVKLEAGHASQNLLLQAMALNLGAVPIGAFRDSEVAEVLQLPPDHEPLYLISVGRPVASDG